MNAILIGLLWLGLTFTCLPTQAHSGSQAECASEELPASTLMYVSDYFSFVGRDSQGAVAFAFDNNRGRDGGAYQAEHFLVFHDEQAGWIDLRGNGRYENLGKALGTIPDSPFFRFQGTPRRGMTIVSESNRLVLQIEPAPERTGNRQGGAAVWMGSAPAVLTWQGRTIPGRVIYEYLMMSDFNRLTRTYWDLWSEYQGFYLTAGEEGDVYLHSQRSKRIAPLIGMLNGFSVLAQQTELMNDLKVEVLDRELALGFYRWPTAWRISWTGSRGPAQLTLKQVSRTSIGNWAIGGFSMAIVRGELDYAGKKLPIYGFAELIM